MVQSDGKIVAGGLATQTGRFNPVFTALARYNMDGSLDNTFGSGGKVTTSAVRGPAITLAELANGHILALCGSNIVEFSAAGALESSVNGGTLVSTSRSGSEAFQNDGKFLQIQSALVRRRVSIIKVVRFDDNGSVDNAFNNPPFGTPPPQQELPRSRFSLIRKVLSVVPLTANSEWRA